MQSGEIEMPWDGERNNDLHTWEQCQSDGGDIQHMAQEWVIAIPLTGLPPECK